MNIKPLADRVLILPAPAEEKTIGGIIIPDTAKEKPLKGEVVAVGHGTKDEEMVLKVGDTVLYSFFNCFFTYLLLFLPVLQVRWIHLPKGFNRNCNIFTMPMITARITRKIRRKKKLPKRTTNRLRLTLYRIMPSSTPMITNQRSFPSFFSYMS